MTEGIISANEASKSFLKILQEVHDQGRSFEIKQDGEIVAKLVPVLSKKIKVTKLKDMISFFKHAPLLDREDAKLFEEDIDTIRSQSFSRENKWDS